MVASLTGPYLDQSKLAIVILKSAWQSDYFKALLKPSLCDSSDGLLLGRRPGGRWTILSSLSIRQGLPARWAGSYLPVSLGAEVSVVSASWSLRDGRAYPWEKARPDYTYTWEIILFRQRSGGLSINKNL